jgi:hypothetical protein
MSPDSTLCLWRADKCALAVSCYRALAEPSEWRQSFFAPDRPGPSCPYYIHETPMDARCKPQEEK